MQLGHCYRLPENRLDPAILRRELADRLAPVILGKMPLTPRPPQAADAVDGAEALLGYTTNQRPIYAYFGQLVPILGQIGLIYSRDWFDRVCIEDRKNIGLSACDSGGFWGGIGCFEETKNTSSGSEYGDSIKRSKMLQALSSPSWLAVNSSSAQTVENYILNVFGTSDKYLYRQMANNPRNAPAPLGDLLEHFNKIDPNGIEPIRVFIYAVEVRNLAPPMHGDLRAIVVTKNIFPIMQEVLIDASMKYNFPLLPELIMASDISSDGSHFLDQNILEKLK